MSNAQKLDQTFYALSDPTRRAVIDLLRRRPHRAGELAERLDMTAPALSRHLRVLRQSRLIAEDAVDADARVRLYRLEQASFTPLRRWLDLVEAYWGDQLQAFKQHAEAKHKVKR